MEKTEYNCWEDGINPFGNTYSPLACHWHRWEIGRWMSWGIWWTTDMERFGPPWRAFPRWRWKGRDYALLWPYRM